MSERRAPRAAFAWLLPALLLVTDACSRNTPDAPPAAPTAAPSVPAKRDVRGALDPRRIAFDPANPQRLLVVEADGTVSIWDVTDPRRPARAWAVSAAATDAQFLPDGHSIVAAGRDGRLHAWDADNHEIWQTAAAHQGAVRAVAVGPDRIASAGEDGVIRLWRFDGTPAGTLGGDGGMALSVAFSPDGEWLAAESADTRLRLWHRDRTGEAFLPEATFRAPIERYQTMIPSLVKLDVAWGWDRSLAFSPDSTRLAAAGFDGNVQLWRLDGSPDAAPLTSDDGHHLRAVAFAADGRRLAAASLGGAVHLWSLDGTPPALLPAHQRAAVSVAFAPTGDRLASAGLDGTVVLWSAEGEKLGALPR